MHSYLSFIFIQFTISCADPMFQRGPKAISNNTPKLEIYSLKWSCTTNRSQPQNSCSPTAQNPSLSLLALSPPCCLSRSLAPFHPQNIKQRNIPLLPLLNPTFESSNQVMRVTPLFSISRAFHSPMGSSLVWSIGGDRIRSPSMAARVTRG